MVFRRFTAVPFCLGLILLVLAGLPLSAATVLERAVDVEIRPDGSVLERTHLRVRLDEPADFERWSPHFIYLDENRELVTVSASVTRSDGQTVKVSRKDLDTHEVASGGELHSSRAFRSVTFPVSPVGSVLAVDYEVRERPWFPGGEVSLGSDEAVQALRVSVRGAGSGWRFRIDGALPGLAVEETAGGVTVTAAGLPALAPPEEAPGSAQEGAVLRYAWGDAAGWEGVGTWYEGLLVQVPRNAEPVRQKARELIAGLPGKRERLDALAAFARRQVRYVAVEVGIGGYRPHPPQQVMERLWGDCKDKALLLVEMLREAGIEAYPALIRLDPQDRVDREFPSPFQFNHMIVAVVAEGLGLPESAPVAGGYLFVDATQERGGIDWLQPAVQDQEALVVRDGRGILVRTPTLGETEGMGLTVELELAAAGEAVGTARLNLRGETAATFLSLLAAGKPLEVDRAMRRVFNALLPAGASLSDLAWQSLDGGVPDVRLDAKVRLASLGARHGRWPPPPAATLHGGPARAGAPRRPGPAAGGQSVRQPDSLAGEAATGFLPD